MCDRGDFRKVKCMLREKEKYYKHCCFLICFALSVFWSSIGVMAKDSGIMHTAQNDASMFIKEESLLEAPSDRTRILLAKYPEYDLDMDLRMIRIAKLEVGSSFEEYIVKQLKAKEAKIDVASYQIDREDIYSVFSGVLNRHPELYYVYVDLRYTYSLETNCVSSLIITYLNYDESAVESEVQNVLSMIDENMTDVEKALCVHDYLCVEVEYAYQDYLNDSVSLDAHNLKGALVDKIAVCDGYAGAFQYLMHRLSIPCNIITGISNGGDHAWNQVCLDGKWYLVDVTWDDPVWDFYGNVQKNYFLKSEDAFDAHTWNKADYESCSDTTYDDAFWNGGTACMLYQDGVWYFAASDSNLYQHDFNLDPIDSKGRKVVELGGKWPVFGSSQSWVGNYSKLALRNNIIYYSLPDSIWSYNLATGKKTMQFEVNTDNGYVYGMDIENGRLYYQIAQKFGVEDRTTEFFSLGKNYNIGDAKITLSKREFTFNGTKQYPDITVKIDDELLVEGSEYELKYDYPASGIGEVTVSVIGKGSYAGTKTAVYEVLKTAPQIGVPSSYIYKNFGDSSFSLNAYTDMGVIEYESDNTNVAKVDVNGNVTIKNAGMANITLRVAQTEEYGSASARVVVEVEPKLISGVVTLEGTSFMYTGQPITPNATVSGLNAGTDYKLSYENNVHVGTATLLIVGKGNYKGTIRKTFTIEVNPDKPDVGEDDTTDNNQGESTSKTQQSIAVAAAFVKRYGDSAFNLNASAKTPLTYISSNSNIVSVTSGGRVTIKGVGTAYITVRAAQSEVYASAQKIVKVTVGRKNISANISLAYTKTAYTGKARVPSVRVPGLFLNKDYKVKYINNVKVGQAKVTITGIGKYQGTITKTFIIVPQKPKAPKVSSGGKKKIKVTWKKVNCQGYEIVFSRKSNFKKIDKKVTVSGGSKVKKVVSKFKSKKTYYVKIRAYQKINKVKYYGDYSPKKKIKVK